MAINLLDSNLRLSAYVFSSNINYWLISNLFLNIDFYTDFIFRFVIFMSWWVGIWPIFLLLNFTRCRNHVVFLLGTGVIFWETRSWHLSGLFLHNVYWVYGTLYVKLLKPNNKYHPNKVKVANKTNLYFYLKHF